ncbi:MAG: PAS domain-containing sensor histidine kinase [Desulfobacteraceae bacterium 4572_130]|nr:MAG: PAS domain-containing sensor histidine kinase [Desulfobacteraceae bacterium 4572_130]
MEKIKMNSFESILFLKDIQAEEEILKIKKQVKEITSNIKVQKLFEQFSNRISKIADKKIQYLQDENKELIESEKSVSQIIRGSMVPTFVINQNHIITHWNRACEKLTGYAAKNAVGTDTQWFPFRSEKRPTLADLIVTESEGKDVDKYYSGLWQKSTVIEGAYEAEEFFPHLGENGKWIFFTAAPIKSRKGEIVGAIETLWDKTEVKKIEEERERQNEKIALLYKQKEKSEEKYHSLFDNNPNPIFIINTKTFKILDVNPRAANDYQYTKKEIIGKSFLELGEKDDETIIKGLEKLSINQSILLTKKRHYKKGRKPFFVNLKVSYANYSLRDVLIVSATDITESIEKDTQLIQAGKMATLGTMAAGMAHEINQPLNIIQICGDLILKMMKKGYKISDDELKDMVNDIITNVGRAAGVIKHVRDFARQSDRIVKKININDPINDVFKIFGHQLKAHEIEIELDLTFDIPKIRAEHNRLEQVFINLVSNAIDSMDEKTNLTTSGSKAEKKLKFESFIEKNHVVIIVSDTGVGMSKDVKEKLFEPFFTTKETGKGTGLGTSISYGIIKDYGGTIKVESEKGKGSSFKIKFPYS